jgi:hypothetical protein
MKKEIAEYIEGLTESGSPLTDSQARAIAYWEYVDFQNDVVEPEVMCRAAVNKLLKGIRR